MIGVAIKQLRKKNKITQEELANVLGISKFAVRKYELEERNPDYELLLKIADYFNVSLDYLFGRNLNRIGNVSIITHDEAINIPLNKLTKENKQLVHELLLDTYCLLGRHLDTYFDTDIIKHYSIIYSQLSSFDSRFNDFIKDAKRFKNINEVKNDMKATFLDIKTSIDHALEKLLKNYLDKASNA